MDSIQEDEFFWRYSFRFINSRRNSLPLLLFLNFIFIDPRLTDFRGIDLFKEEARVLTQLEMLSGGLFQLRDDIPTMIQSEKRMIFISENKRITGLLLSNMDLKEIPASIGNIKSLEYLDLSFNDLKKLPDTIGNLKSLKELNLEDNHLTELPYTIGDLASLHTLNVSANKLTTLPESFGDIGSLASIHQDDIFYFPKSDRECVKLRMILEEFSKPTSCLELLDLSENRLKKLPDSVGKLISLRQLYLSLNNLKSLPKTFQNLISLEALDLSFNNIKTPPKSIKELEMLKMVNIRGNK